MSTTTSEDGATIPAPAEGSVEATPTIQPDGAGIRYVFYVTIGWLAATALAVAVLVLVIPRLL